MKARISFVLFLCSLLTALIGCGGKTPPAAEEVRKPVSSIVVLPVTIQKSEQGYDYITTRQLEAGAAVLEELAKELLAERTDIRFLTAAGIDSLLGDFLGTPKEMVRRIGEQSGADATLAITAIRFSERDGGEYSVNQPASVSFRYELTHVESGATLCLGVFDETQQTLLSNLFTFSKASSRGFKWITARQLAREGMQEKFNDCRYLAR
ncbi:MAG: hypothetical protein ACOY4H_00895 [Thermodesulfobacteriota bacterium]